MEKENYFEKYKTARLTLAKAMANFYDCILPVEEAKKYGIESENCKREITCYFHRFEQIGKFIWSTLDISCSKQPYISSAELSDIIDNIADDRGPVMVDSEYYKKQYLEISLCILELVTKYYNDRMTVKEVKAMDSSYSKSDIYDGKVDVCYHKSIKTGEALWKFLGFTEPCIGNSVVINKRQELTNELLALTFEKNKKLVK